MCLQKHNVKKNLAAIYFLLSHPTDLRSPGLWLLHQISSLIYTFIFNLKMAKKTCSLL